MFNNSLNNYVFVIQDDSRTRLKKVDNEIGYKINSFLNKNLRNSTTLTPYSIESIRSDNQGALLNSLYGKIDSFNLMLEDLNSKYFSQQEKKLKVYKKKPFIDYSRNKKPMYQFIERLLSGHTEYILIKESSLYDSYFDNLDRFVVVMCKCVNSEFHLTDLSNLCTISNTFRVRNRKQIKSRKLNTGINNLTSSLGLTFAFDFDGLERLLSENDDCGWLVDLLPRSLYSLFARSLKDLPRFILSVLTIMAIRYEMVSTNSLYKYKELASLRGVDLKDSLNFNNYAFDYNNHIIHRNLILAITSDWDSEYNLDNPDNFKVNDDSNNSSNKIDPLDDFNEILDDSDDYYDFVEEEEEFDNISNELFDKSDDYYNNLLNDGSSKRDNSHLSSSSEESHKSSSNSSNESSSDSSRYGSYGGSSDSSDYSDSSSSSSFSSSSSSSSSSFSSSDSSSDY